MDLQSSIIGLRILCLSPKRNFYPKVAFMLNQTRVYVQLSSKRAFQPLKAETNRHLLFYTLSSSSHFSSPEKPSASEVVKLSSRRHELTVEICHRCSVLPILPFWVCSSVAAPGILFRRVIKKLKFKKNLIKREFEYNKLSTNK